MIKVFALVQLFSELDENVQDAFKGYLQERGIDSQLAEYLHYQAEQKEQKQYVKWMKELEILLRK